MKEDGSGDVIGQIAHNAQRPAELMGQCRKRDPQYILLCNGELRLGKALAQPCRLIPINFNCMDMAGPCNQRRGQGRLAGANLYYSITGLGVNRLNNCCDDSGIMQKILAESLARDVVISDRHA